MSDDCYLYLLLTAKVFVVVHFACNKGVGSLSDGIFEKKGTCSTTDGHFAYWPVEQRVALYTLHIERTLEHIDELASGKRMVEFTDDSTATGDAVDLLLGKKTAVAEPHLLRYLEVYAVFGIVDVGVHGCHCDIALDGFGHGALHKVNVGDTFQTMEYEGMVAHDEVASPRYGLFHHFFGDVKAQ